MTKYNYPFDRAITGLLNDMLIVSPIDTVGAETVAEIGVHVASPLSLGTSQELRAVIYAGPSLPTSLIALSQSVTMQGASGINELVAFPLVDAVTLSAGTRYWVGLHLGPADVSGVRVYVQDNKGIPPNGGMLGAPANFPVGTPSVFPSVGRSSGTSALTFELRAAATTPAPVAGLPVSDVALWPRQKTTAQAIIDEVRVRLFDPLKVLMTDAELMLYVNDALRSATPSYQEVRELTYTFSGNEFEFPLELSIPERYEHLFPLVLRWTYKLPTGASHSMVVTNYLIDTTRFILPQMLSWSVPEDVTAKVAFMVDPTLVTSPTDEIRVSHRWMVESVFIRSAPHVTSRGGRDLSLEIMDAKALAGAELMRSPGAPTIGRDGRIF